MTVKKKKGIQISRGVVHGPVFYFEKGQLSIPRHRIEEAEFDAEVDRFLEAVRISKEELTQVRDLVLDHLDEDHARIIDAQMLAVQDEEMVKSVKDMVIREKKNASWAYFDVMDRYESMLLQTLSDFFQDRTVDLHDIKKRVLYHLQGDKSSDIPKITKPSIIVTEKISPGGLINIKHNMVLGLITKEGGYNSHAGILARAFRIPYLSDVIDIDELNNCSEIILDADNEEILIDIDSDDVHRYTKRIRNFQKQRIQIITDKVASATKNGEPFHIYLNAGFVDEVKPLNPELIQGIGLFRTEYLCIAENKIPDEETQFQAYKSVLQSMGNLPVIFRVFDFGRDKLLALLDMEIIQEDHVFDEWGGIGFLLENPDILKTQLRALLRASVYGNAKIMLPLVMFTEELRQTNKMLDTIRKELSRESIPFSQTIELGAMIETSSVLDELDSLSNLVDFFSIGTNDLALYLIGSGRAVDLTKNYYHPKIFHAIKKVIQVGQRVGVPVNVCGEMASDPYALIGLTAIGIRSVSVGTSALESVSKHVASMDTTQIEKLADPILKADSPASIYSILTQYQQKDIT